MTTLRPLVDADTRCGGKAATLSVLMRHGFAVPPGFVVTDPNSHSWTADLATTLAELGPGPYAARSSALAEDRRYASFAGQFHTALNISAAAVVDAVTDVARSGATAQVAGYASSLGLSLAEGGVPVLVQQMVAPNAAGVLFTRHPVTGADQCVIEATTGLADQLVSGDITPERWTIAGDAIVDEHAAADPALTHQEVVELTRLGQRVETVLGGPLDIEWAMAAGQIWVLQARPITTLGATPTAPQTAFLPAELVTGTPGSPGRGHGTTNVVVDLDDFAGFAAGDVLVCRATSPAWTPLLARAAAVVTETGGLLSHAAIVAREFGIPAVLAAENSMSVLREPTVVQVDGDHGIVTELNQREDQP